MEMVYVEMKNAGIYPDIYTFNTLLSRYAKMPKNTVEKAERVLQDMESAGVSKNTETYNSVIMMYGRARTIVSLNFMPMRWQLKKGQKKRFYVRRH